jgi:OPA family glycerol-3-phosphate transporter-like MFS transporter
MILKEMYTLPDYMSILLTMFLPILAIFGTSVAVMLHKKIKDFVLLAAVLFFATALLIGLVILCLPTGLIVITLGCFGIVSCLMAGVNNIITSMAPLYWKDEINSGLLAGILNGFCYLGSTLSSYGLGVIADFGGWNAVFWLLFILCIIAVVTAVCYVGRKLFVKNK